jgi:hypothetical protein
MPSASLSALYFSGAYLPNILSGPRRLTHDQRGARKSMLTGARQFAAAHSANGPMPFASRGRADSRCAEQDLSYVKHPFPLVVGRVLTRPKKPGRSLQPRDNGKGHGDGGRSCGVFLARLSTTYSHARRLCGQQSDRAFSLDDICCTGMTRCAQGQ